ncbi:MAG: type II toxin-antitoxin system CcdA family antitoxin [Gemmatimonadota bacterium]|nr:type II toxin-antitoxin system CcdA family antitoxin [Gemmatimonadota bacterium]
MKTKLTLSIDSDLLPKAKRYARARGVSVSELVESAMRQLADEQVEETFAQRWRGKFAPANRDDDRYGALAKKYL